MIRGTTPSIRLRLPFDGRVMTKFRVVFSQKESIYLHDSREIFVKGDWDSHVKGNVLTVKLSEKDTSMLDPRRPVEIVVEFKWRGEVLKSKPLVVPVDDFSDSKHVSGSLDGSVKVMKPYELDFGVLHDLDYLPEYHEKLRGRHHPDQHPIEAITGLKEALENVSTKVFSSIPGALVVAQTDGTLKACELCPEDLLVKRIADESYASKDLVQKSTEQIVTETKEIINQVSQEVLQTKETVNQVSQEIFQAKGTLEQITSEVVGTKEIINRITSEAIEASVIIENPGETVVKIPDPLKGYKNLLVYQNGKLLVKDMHYLRSGDYISLINYVAYATDVFTFMYVGRVIDDKAVSHEHQNLDVLDSLTQDMVDEWNSSKNSVKSIMFNRAQIFPDEKGVLNLIGVSTVGHTHRELVSVEELFSDGKIKQSLLPEMGGGLELGETAETAFRGDLGVLAYEHSQEKHAPITAQENVIEVFKIASVEIPVVKKTVEIPIATSEYCGVVRSSDAPGKVRVEADGTMTVPQVKLSSLVVEEDEELILNAGNAI